MAWTRGPKRLCRRVCFFGGMLFCSTQVFAQPPVRGDAVDRTGPVHEAARPASPRLATGADKTAGSPEQKLERAKLAYQRGDYGSVVLLLRPLLYPETLLAQEEQVLLSHKLLALSYYFEHEEAGAEQEFNLLLSLRPDFALDPVVDPLQAVAFLDDIRRRNAERLEEIRRRQAEEEQRRRIEAEQLQRQAEVLAQQRARRIYIERVVYKRFSAIDLLPFGIPQLILRRRALGTALLVSEALTGAASLATWLTARYRYPNGRFPPSELLTTQALTGTYLSTGVVFWGLVFAGLVDALLHARTVVEVRELSAPPSDLPSSKPPVKAAARVSLRLDVGAGPGIGIGGLF